MKTLFLALLMLGNLVYALPSPSMAQARALSAQVLEKPLYWTPFRMPYEVKQTSQEQDARYLQALFEQGLVVREPITEPLVQELSGVMRKQLELSWRYDYKQVGKIPEEEGFYYGKGKIVSLKLSPTLESSIGLYVQVQAKWKVEDIQPWIKNPVLRTARTLRRSLSSDTEPFEKTLYLQYQNGTWLVWKAED